MLFVDVRIQVKVHGSSGVFVDISFDSNERFKARSAMAARRQLLPAK